MTTASVRRWIRALLFSTLILTTRLRFAPHRLATFEPQIPAAVLEHRHIRGEAPVITLWKGQRREEAARIDAPSGGLIVWLWNPRTEFYSIVQREFAPRAAGSVLYTDLPAEHGSRTPGEYELRG
jgi:hypothetical protein